VLELAAEVSPGEVIMAGVMALITVFVGLIAWVGREKIAKLDQVEKKQQDQSEQLAVIKADKLATIVMDQGERLRVLEGVVGEIRGDVKHIRTMLDDERRP